jgi:tetratricopeptide (TPR) repeat protein
MPQELIQLNARKIPTRVVLILMLMAATVWSYFAFRWYIGNTLAEFFTPGDNSLQVARIAENFAPNDPITHWRLAQVSQKQLPLDQTSVALNEFEQAVAVSPNDYRFWMMLGTAREQASEPDKAEVALRRAISLAPSYSYPHWYLGNLLLRTQRYDEAFQELRVACEADPSQLRPQLFNLVWAVYGSDPDAMAKAVGPDPQARAEFAVYLANQQKYDDGLKIWNTLSADEKKSNKASGDSIVASLMSIMRFADTVKVWNDLAPTPGYLAQIGRMTDGSFEEVLTYGPDTVFGWQVKSAPQTQIGIDPQTSHTGGRSLRLVFQVRTQLDATLVSQLVPLQKDTNYDFECYVKTAKFETGGPLTIQILDANSGTSLGTSESAPSGDTDWSRVALSFKTGDKTEAVTIRIYREGCGENVVCPIFGNVWYDDFSINRHN